MNRIAGLIASVLLLTLPLSAREIGARYHPGIDVSSARTYAWMEMPELEEGHPLAVGSSLDLKIRGAVEEQLAAAGLRPAGEAEPDLWVIYYAGLDNRLQIANLDYHVGDWLDFQSEFGDRNRRIRQYEKATLFVDLVDAESEELAWCGWATSAAPTVKDLQRKAEKRVTRSIRKMFRGFGKR